MLTSREMEKFLRNRYLFFDITLKNILERPHYTGKIHAEMSGAEMRNIMGGTIDYAVVGRRMQRLRKENGYTQEQIAAALNVTVAFISNIENNRAKMNLRVVTYYARLLNVSIDYLLQSEDDEESSRDTILNQEILRLLQHYTIEEKEKLVKILRLLKES